MTAGRTGATPARVAAVVAALVVAAWFGLGFVQQRAVADASAILNGGAAADPAQRRHAEALADRAGTLNPDRGVDLLRAQAQLAAGDAPAALRTLLSVVADQPDDLAAWVQIALIASDRDPALTRRAVAAGRRLSPPVPAP